MIRLSRNPTLVAAICLLGQVLLIGCRSQLRSGTYPCSDEVPVVDASQKRPLESLLDCYVPKGVIVMVAGPDSDTLYRPTPLDYQKLLYANHSITPAGQPLMSGYLLAVHLNSAPDHALTANAGTAAPAYNDPDKEGIGHEFEFWDDRDVEFMIADNLFQSARGGFLANYMHRPSGQEQGQQIDQVRAQYPAAGTRVCTGGFVGVIMTPILTDTGAPSKGR